MILFGIVISLVNGLIGISNQGRKKTIFVKKLAQRLLFSPQSFAINFTRLVLIIYQFRRVCQVHHTYVISNLAGKLFTANSEDGSL